MATPSTPYNAAGARPPSPAISVGTTYPDDQTSLYDTEAHCDEETFAARCQDQLRLYDLSEDEAKYVPAFPLLEPPPPRTVDNEGRRNALLHQNLEHLRKVVKALEENEMFEEAILQGSKVLLRDDPPKTDIDSILASMIDMPPPSAAPSPIEGESHGLSATTAMNSINTSGTATGRKGIVFKGKAKARKP